MLQQRTCTVTDLHNDVKRHAAPCTLPITRTEFPALQTANFPRTPRPAFYMCFNCYPVWYEYRGVPKLSKYIRKPL